MKGWNTHSWYITGILVFLLIISISLQWDRIPDLPGVISFALGLSSLLLAIIAIIQTLTGSSEVAAGLSSIRTAADDIKGVAAAMTGVGGRVAESSDKLFKAVEQLGQTGGQTNTYPDLHVDGSQKTSGGVVLEKLTYGGSISLYAAAWSVETGRSFNMGEFVKDDEYIVAAYQDGFLAALIRYGILDGEMVEGRTRVNKINPEPVEVRSILRGRRYPGQQEKYNAALDIIDEFFVGNNTD